MHVARVLHNTLIDGTQAFSASPKALYFVSKVAYICLLWNARYTIKVMIVTKMVDEIKWQQKIAATDHTG